MTTTFAVPQPDDHSYRRARLTVREVEVLAAWMRSATKASAGRELYIAPSTVAVHIARVRDKYASLGRPTATKTALAARLVQDGYLSLEDLL